MRSNYVRAKLRAGDPSIGTWQTIPNTGVSGLLSRAPFEWLTLEMEHTPANWETVSACCAIIANAGKIPLVRIPWNTGENLKRALDNGAFGVIVPMVNSREEAEAAVRHTRYQPLGTRSIGGQMHAVNFATDTATYFSKANGEILLIVMIEHVDAVERVEEILSVPGVDAWFIGPNDLHNSMGLRPVFESDNPRFLAAVAKILETGKRLGIPGGIHVVSGEAAKRRIAEGFQFIAIGSDAGMMLSQAAALTRDAGMASDSAAAIKY